MSEPDGPALGRPMPYLGLRPFGEGDHALFFGREVQVNAMLHQLEDHRFVAVVGSSGSGKSSLVLAGLLPALREGFLLGTTDWRTVVLKPGHQPFERLAAALHTVPDTAAEVAIQDAPLTAAAAATLQQLRLTERGLVAALESLALSAATRVLIVVDQFEELFAFRRAGVNRDTVASRDDSAAFVNLLLHSAADSAARIWVILTMRSDFIGDCEAFLGLPEQISRSQFLVPRLDREQMQEAITLPATGAHAGIDPFAFEEGLVNRIINDAGDRPDQLPLMQHALLRTWQEAVERVRQANSAVATAATSAGTPGASAPPPGAHPATPLPVVLRAVDYETAGTIDRALSLDADSAWKDIKDDPKKAGLAQRLFLLLCDISPDGQITRRRPKASEVLAVTGATLAELRAVVEVFQNNARCFLLPFPASTITAETYLDISHEALLRQWRHFADDWQARERRDASELRRLAELASLRQQGQDVSLLQAQDLLRITGWQKRVSAAWAARYVTPESWDQVMSFIAESGLQVQAQKEEALKRAEKERLRTKAVAVAIIGFAILSSLFGIGAYRASDRSERDKQSAIEALVRSKADRQTAEKALQVAETETARAQKLEGQALTAKINAEDILALVTTIGSNPSAALSPEERAAFWKLAEIPSDRRVVRTEVLDHWFGSEQSLRKAFGKALPAWHSAIGLDASLRDHIRPRLPYFVTLFASPPPNKIERLGSTSLEILAELKPYLGPKDNAASSSTELRRLLTWASQFKWDPLADPASTDDMIDIVRHLEPADAKTFVIQLLADTPSMVTWAGSSSDFNDFVVAAIHRIPPKECESIAGTFIEKQLQRLQPEITNDALRNIWDVRAIVELAPYLSAERAASVCNYLATKLPATKDIDTQLYSQWSRALSVISAQLTPESADQIARQLAGALPGERRVNDARLPRMAHLLNILIKRTDPPQAASLASRGAEELLAALETWSKTDLNLYTDVAQELAEFCGQMESQPGAAVAARGAGLLAAALAYPPYQSAGLFTAAATLAVRMEKSEGRQMAGELAGVMVEIFIDPRREQLDRPSQTDTFARLATLLDSDQATALALRLSPALQATSDQESRRRARLGSALSALLKPLESAQSRDLANSLTDTLLKGLIAGNQGENELADALASVVSQQDPARISATSERLAKALEDARDAQTVQLASLGYALGAVSRLLPNARNTHLLAMSHLMLPSYTEDAFSTFAPREHDALLSQIYESLGTNDLVETLKWPFSVGQVRNIALATLEKKTGKKFENDLWRFVKQAPALGFKNLDGPARRPRTEDAIKELAAMRGSTSAAP